MQRSSYSFDYYTAVTYTTQEFCQADINKTAPGWPKPRRIIRKCFADYDEMFDWTNAFVKEQNALSIREFLANKPTFYRECFEMSLSGFILTSGTLKMLGSLKKFNINDVDRTEFYQRLSIHRIECVLALLSRWGILWEFQPGKFVNIVRGL